ncbi:anthranilate synthase component I [Pectinatus haikarae]|uniref:Anthranilate synthase component 1 n=1 Tax=Pectinatus haikarae TaxID=349096 RepID=A0ABT9YBJ0_9FIRM|nr:anthranilate synthase component I [Pectinatus haikarae]MDQ0205076.1 anthranilate synthase component 1 [Pectinatus haikarae]
MINYKPGLAELKKMADSYDVLPVSRTLFADIKTPIAVLKAMKNVSDCCFLLESVESGEKWGRYSFLGFDPSVEIKCKDNKMMIKDKNGEKSFYTENPSKELRTLLQQYKSPRFDFLPPLTGGLIGYFSYEYIRYSEKKLNFAGKQQELNDVDLMLFDKIVAFDNLKQKIFLIANIRTDDLEKNYEKAQEELDNLAMLVSNGAPCNEQPGKLTTPFSGEMTAKEYEKLVEKTKVYIKEGDIFQAVPSNRQEAGFTGSLLNAYRMLRTSNPSPYMFYLSGRQIELTGASPETLVKLKDGELSTFPIAGTMPRGKNAAEDAALEEKLCHDEKELAEHNMLVDLGRNDLGKISEFGTVKVKNFHKIERFSHVMHITSTVTGRIRKDKDALDAIEATLPAGTLSGAPKVRAVQILHELEKSMRGIYGGAVGYIDFTGNMDVCIGIRMAVAYDNKVYVRSGGGVVFDSVPQTEYMESQNKARAMIEAIERTQEVGE